MPFSILFAGDVMTGRGIDQVLESSSDPELREPYLKDARDYVALAEDAHGSIPQPVDPAWPWGDALAILDELGPDVRVINLETTVTTSDDFAPKGINYRMHPANVGCLAVARPDVCVLANNHVLDFGPSGLMETLDTLDDAGLRHAGAGRELVEACRPAVVEAGGQRVVVHAVGHPSSGVRPEWAAWDDTPGVACLSELSESGAESLLDRIDTTEGITVVSVHAGSNWGYDVSGSYRGFAHRLIEGGVNVVHGHSSHHPRPVELHRGGLVLYGCGDLVNDYEGISGHASFRSDLRLLYVLTIDPHARTTLQLRMVPLRARRLRLERADAEETAWLHRLMVRISGRFGTAVGLDDDGTLVVRPS